nr:gamma-glutamyltransferase [Nesterenkonia ebinurensis]
MTSPALGPLSGTDCQKEGAHQAKGRLVALDAARSVAILGMIIVNTGPLLLDGPASYAIRSMYGRASILFVVLAGVSVALMTSRSTSPVSSHTVSPAVGLAWRGLVLLFVGLLLQPLPHGASVILPLYGALFFAAILLERLPSRWLLRMSAAWIVLGPLAWMLVNNDGPATQGPASLGNTPTGIVEAVLITGPYPLLVWAAPFVFGLWLGRQNLRQPLIQWTILVSGTVAGFGAFLTAQALMRWLGEPDISAVGFDWLRTAYGHSHTPLWLVSAIGTALMILGGFLLLSPYLGRVIVLFSTAGRMPLSAYVIHLLVLAVWVQQPPPTTARGLLVSIVIFAGILVFAMLWFRMPRRGPLELVIAAPLGWLTQQSPRQASTTHPTTENDPDASGTQKRKIPMKTTSLFTGTSIFAIATIVVTACALPVDEDPEPPAPAGTQPGQQIDDMSPTPETEIESGPLLEQQGVSAGHPLAAEAGVQILAEGGNAVDAAIAVAFAVSVVEPFASGIGGGGSAILAGPAGEPVVYDYREVVDNNGQIPSSNTGIPGFVAGMGQLHADYGELEWSQVLAPAYVLAAEGFEVSSFLSIRMQQPDGMAAVSGLDHYAPGGQSLSVGEILIQDDLATTLNAISENGWQDFYTGPLAESLVSSAEGIDAGSLADYEVIVTEPVTGSFGDYEILGPPPALPGAPMIQMLQVAEANGIADMDPASAEYIDTLSQAWLIAEESVFTQLGDPNFVDVPVDEMTDAETNAQLMSSTFQSENPLEIQTASSADAPNTTHISVVDENGLAVSMTNTIMSFWGSGQMVDGYFLNNHLSRFEAINSPANQPEPGRRTVTWSNPVMILDDQGRPELVIGSPGGRQILNIVGTVLTQWALQDRTLEEAINTRRFRADNNVIYLEEGHGPQTIGGLESLGWGTQVWPDAQASFGSVNLLHIDYDTGEISSADDFRREGTHRIISGEGSP